MSAWKFDDDMTCFSDGTGTYERGYYATSVDAYLCGAEPEFGPFPTRQQAVEALEAANA